MRNRVKSGSIWVMIVLWMLVLMVLLFYGSWNGIMPLLFRLPHLSPLNALALVGMVLINFLALWGMAWLVYASFRQA